MPSLFARPLIGLITLYRYTLSPLVGGHCRYLPTCSEYGREALRQHGAWAGSWMIAARLCRCRPGGGHGFDPVPSETRGRWWKPWAHGVWRYAASVSLRSTAPPQAGEQKEIHQCPSH